MKFRSLVAILLICVLAVAGSSCMTSRSKSGCPSNPQSNYRFRG